MENKSAFVGARSFFVNHGATPATLRAITPCHRICTRQLQVNPAGENDADRKKKSSRTVA